jgi:two-component system, OmpR family, heavy metal sensor histidine kinase CusS
MKRLSFRLRIALLSALISGAVLAGFGVTAYYLISRERLAAVDREIRDLAQRHPGWMAGGPNLERFSDIIESVYGDDHAQQVILLLRDAAGQTRFVSPHWPTALPVDTLDLQLADAPALRRPEAEGRGPLGGMGLRGGGARRGPVWATDDETRDAFGPGAGRRRGGPFASRGFTKIPRFITVESSQATWRIGILGSNGDRLVLGLNLAGLQAELGRLRNRFLLVLPLALALIGGGGWWIAGHAVRPLRSIVEVAERVTARGLDQRIPPSAEDPQIAELVRVLNGMMDRLEASFHQATRFSADASHELKTPLAVMQGELEQAVQSAAPGSPAQQVYANLLEETHKLKAITQNLLLLARADAGQLPLTLAPVNLSAELAGLWEDLEAMAAETGIRVESQAERELWVQADWPLLRQAVWNLLHNSLRYNEPEGWVHVRLTARNGQVELDVSNGGPGIPTADQPKLFERFFRGDPARGRDAEGSGLGLSLAHEIVRAHGGTLQLGESRPGRTSFVLSLPGGSPARS